LVAGGEQSRLRQQSAGIILVTVTRMRSCMTVKKPPSANSAGSGRWRLQDAKARFSQVVRDARAHGPQRVTLHGRDTVVVICVDEFDRLQRPVTGRDVVAALTSSPLAEVVIERLSVKSKVRDIDL
jgi:prevent-host-death family protein